MSDREAGRERTRFEPGSGNVFADIGIPDPEQVLAKARLADLIGEAVKDRGLTQVQAGQLLGIDQGSVSKLVNGRLDGFSQERLIRYLNVLGLDVEIVVRGPNPSGQVGNLTVASR
jgi:predicted XRE-type DNA-binding protein